MGVSPSLYVQYPSSGLFERRVAPSLWSAPVARDPVSRDRSRLPERTFFDLVVFRMILERTFPPGVRPP
jgi:hypothetical protein